LHGKNSAHNENAVKSKVLSLHEDEPEEDAFADAEAE
jgi:hypothetical protein